MVDTRVLSPHRLGWIPRTPDGTLLQGVPRPRGESGTITTITLGSFGTVLGH